MSGGHKIIPGNTGNSIPDTARRIVEIVKNKSKNPCKRGPGVTDLERRRERVGVVEEIVYRATRYP